MAKFEVLDLVILVTVALVVLNLVGSAVDIGFEVSITKGFLLMAIAAGVVIPFVLINREFSLKKFDLLTLVIAVGIIMAIVFFVPDLIGQSFSTAAADLRFAILGN